MPLVINSLGGEETHTYMHTDFNYKNLQVCAGLCNWLLGAFCSKNDCSLKYYVVKGLTFKDLRRTVGEHIELKFSTMILHNINVLYRFLISKLQCSYI